MKTNAGLAGRNLRSAVHQLRRRAGNRRDLRARHDDDRASRYATVDANECFRRGLPRFERTRNEILSSERAEAVCRDDGTREARNYRVPTIGLEVSGSE